MKPCPFCGKEDLYFEQDEEGETNIVCDWCEYKTRIFQTIGDAARWWNTRPIEDELRARIAELEEIDKLRSESVSTLNQANANNEDEIELLEKRIAKLEELAQQLVWVGNDLLTDNANPVTITLFSGLAFRSKELLP